VKDITKLGRDIRKIIIVDDDENNFTLNKENGIKIKPFLGEENNNDTSLFELKKILILFERMGLDDVRKGIKSYEKDIKDKISMNNLGK
jgi:TFIIF-interacting CTD phosphatase-like protein